MQNGLPSENATVHMVGYTGIICVNNVIAMNLET